MLAPARDLLTFERRQLAALDDIVEPWRDLAHRAAEPNVFYDPSFALAAAPVLGRGVEVILAWSAESPRRLVGLLPYKIVARRYGVKVPLMIGWTHPFGPLGTPLIDRDACLDVVAALLAHVAGDDDLPKLLLLPFFHERGPVANALAIAIADHEGRFAGFGSHRRALLRPGAERSGYLDHAVSKKRRKKLLRQRDRLAETGPVTFRLATAPTAIDDALRDFIALEAAGWKGRAGTSITQNRKIERFVESAISRLAAQGQVRISRLYFGAQPIAAALTLTSGDGAWAWKIAYDERFAAASPGVQLHLDLTESLLADTGISFVDSCAVPDHPMIDHIWGERLDIADWLITLVPGATFDRAYRLEALRRHIIGLARTLVRRLRTSG